MKPYSYESRRSSIEFPPTPFDMETAFVMIEHAIGHLPASDTDAISILTEAYKAIGPNGQIPSWEEEEETRERITCDQCELLAINGICCHETGCPNMGSRWDAENREWIKQRECFDCGCTVDADDPCCSAPFEDDESDEEEDVLRSTVDTPEMHDTVLEDAKESLERVTLSADFEHGQWWISDTESGAQWSVNDCETATGEQYFEYEQVTQGDED